jgi:hypothetical protein
MRVSINLRFSSVPELERIDSGVGAGGIVLGHSGCSEAHEMARSSENRAAFLPPRPTGRESKLVRGNDQGRQR